MYLSSINSKNLEALHKFYDWINRTSRAKVVKFESSGTELRSLFDADPKSKTHGDMIRLLSEKIERFRNMDPNTIDYFVNRSMPREWTGNTDIYLCYQLFKLLWLSKDIKLNGQEAPIQLYTSGRGYQSHPGSDKKFIISFLQPLETVRCFYIWYPELDQTPWHWTLPYTEVDTPEEFCDMFPQIKHDTFELEHCNVTITNSDIDVEGNYHFKPFATGAHKACVKLKKIKHPDFKLELPHLSYRDGVHRMGMFKDKSIFNEIRFENDNFYLGDFKFIQYNNLWYPEKFYNFPESLQDTNHKYDGNRSLHFSNARPCISTHRRFQ